MINPNEIPIPWNESEVDKFWQPDPWDEYLPSKGFISDVMLALRGIETPSLFQVWSILFLLSTVIKRDAWLEWSPLNFFCNLYVFIVGPPATGKSTVLNWCEEKILANYWQHIPGEDWQQKKKINIFHSKATPEALFKFLKPKKIKKMDPLKKTPYDLNLGSTGAIITSELATFLGRQQYNMGLIELLTDLYDCKFVADSITQSRGKEELRNIFMTMCGCTTTDGLAASIPEEAFGDGFLSRVIIAHAERTFRSYPRPMIVPGAPTPEDLQKRLAWIATTARNEYVLSPEAEEYYKPWYHQFKEKIQDVAFKRKGYNRYAIHLLKVAMLLRIQRYQQGNVIGLQDLMEARSILDMTMKGATTATEEIGRDPQTRDYLRIKKYIRSKGKVQRQKLLTSFSGRGITASTLNNYLRELHNVGAIEVVDEDGTVQNYPSRNIKELYCWIEEGEDDGS